MFYKMINPLSWGRTSLPLQDTDLKNNLIVKPVVFDFFFKYAIWLRLPFVVPFKIASWKKKGHAESDWEEHITVCMA